MSEVTMPIVFETYKDRENWIRVNASYFTITWMTDLQHYTFYYSTLELARKNAKVAAKHLAKKPVIIYAVYCPLDDVNIGYSTWVESVLPNSKR